MAQSVSLQSSTVEMLSFCDLADSTGLSLRQFSLKSRVAELCRSAQPTVLPSVLTGVTENHSEVKKLLQSNTSNCGHFAVNDSTTASSNLPILNSVADQIMPNVQKDNGITFKSQKIGTANIASCKTSQRLVRSPQKTKSARNSLSRKSPKVVLKLTKHGKSQTHKEPIWLNATFGRPAFSSEPLVPFCELQQNAKLSPILGDLTAFVNRVSVHSETQHCIAQMRIPEWLPPISVPASEPRLAPIYGNSCGQLQPVGDFVGFLPPFDFEASQQMASTFPRNSCVATLMPRSFSTVDFSGCVRPEEQSQSLSCPATPRGSESFCHFDGPRLLSGTEVCDYFEHLEQQESPASVEFMCDNASSCTFVRGGNEHFEVWL